VWLEASYIPGSEKAKVVFVAFSYYKVPGRLKILRSPAWVTCWLIHYPIISTVNKYIINVLFILTQSYRCSGVLD
jgi:hypothetical protein